MNEGGSISTCLYSKSGKVGVISGDLLFIVLSGICLICGLSYLEIIIFKLIYFIFQVGQKYKYILKLITFLTNKI